ncbi:WxL domain-containing protein [Enterococcus innesii]|uniref:WxL domain-containing protein n=1 Tax=Enterococcus innesii TaxID=2839759 RepID=UPI00398501B0
MKQVLSLTLILLLNLNTLLSAAMPLVFAEEKIDQSEYSEVLKDGNKEFTEENNNIEDESTKESTTSTSDEKEECLTESTAVNEYPAGIQSNEEQEMADISLPKSGIRDLITFWTRPTGVPGTNLRLTGNRLRASSSTGVFINTFESDVIEYSMDIYRINSNAEVISTENNIFSFSAMGNERNTAANTRFNDTSPDITHGDILEVYHREPQSIFLGQTLDHPLSVNNNRAYLELTDGGYRLLQFDRVIKKNGTITAATSDEELDDRISDFLDMSGTPNVEAVGFVEYPDRSTIGSSTGTIRVQEKLSTGRFVQKDYTVDFEIKSLSQSDIGNQITFRAQSSNFNATRLVLDGNRLHASSPGMFIINGTAAVIEYSMDIYRLNSSTEVISTENNIFSFSAMRNEQNTVVNTRFNNTSPDITHGDILEVYHRQPQRMFIGDGLDQPLSMSNNRAYLELTDGGYRLLQFDRVITKNGTITTETSDGALDDRISDFLDMSGTPNVEAVGFVEYPDRSTIGSSTGTIRVQEKLSTGRFVQKDYTVDFEIKSLSQSDIGNQITFRAQSSNFNATRLVLDGNRLHASSPGMFIINGTAAVIEYSMDIYRLNSSTEVISTENNIFSFSAMRNEQNTVVNTRFNNTSPDITHGDILEVYHRQPQRMFIGDGLDQPLSMSNNRAYLELTDGGYRLLQFDRVITKNGTITTETSDGALDDRISDFLDMSGTPNVEAVGFVEYPDRSTIGSSTGTIRVQEILSTGRFVQRDYTVDFEIKSSFEFEIEPQSVYLSQTEKVLDFSKIISDVTYGGVALDTTEYEVTIEKMVDTSTVGLKTGTFTVTNTQTKGSMSFDVPIHVLWGDSIELRGYQSRSLGTYTYFPEEEQVNVTWGRSVNDGNVSIHPETGDDIYYTVSLFRPQEQKQVLTDMDAYFNLTGRGNKNPDIINTIPNNRKIDVSVGDIMEIYHRQSLTDSDLLSFYSNESPQALSNVTETSYVELTNQGYQSLTVNRVVPVYDQVLRLGMSKADLDASVNKYLDISNTDGVEIVGFVSYPDTSQIGEQQGTIRVQEKLSNGNYIQKDYDITFSIDYSTLRIEEAPVTFDFGQDNIFSRFHQWITAEKKINTNQVKVFDGRETQTDWMISAQASLLKHTDRTHKTSYISNARYILDIDTGERRTIYADGQSSTIIDTHTQSSETSGSRLTTTIFDSVQLFLPSFSGASGEGFEGEITWTIDMVP